MKRRVSIIIMAILMALGLTALFTACEDDAVEKGDYSVTVLSPEEEPVSGVTVSWTNGTIDLGKATTDEDGKATTSLPLGSYTVVLENYGEAYEYTSVSVGSTMRNVEIQLSVKRVNYTVTVTDKDGAPAEGVSVSWSDDEGTAGSAKTDANGAAACELDYGEYSVTLSDLPEENLYDGAKTVSGSNPSVTFALHGGSAVKYTVTVRSEGGLLFTNQIVNVYSGSTRIASGNTDDDGVYTFSAAPDTYTVNTARLLDGYTFEAITLTAESRNGELILRSAVIDIPSDDITYVMGDIIHNYSFTTPYQIDGAVWSSTVAEILKTKEALIINNWGTNCSWCVTEMPAMQEVYEKYGDKIEIVAVSNYVPYDTDAAIINHYASTGYTFPMMRDTNGLAAKFSVSAWPTTIVIDRYGAVARIEVGAVTSVEAWERMITKYIGDDYVQTFVPGTQVSDSINNEIAKPDIELPADHYDKIAETLHDTSTFPKGSSVTWRGETEYEYAWPFIIGTVENVSPDAEVVYSSNAGKPNTMAIMYAAVNIEAGKVFTFDYYAETENSDVFYMLWDGRIVLTISGNSNGWQTCHLYSEITDGEHTLAITYMKDSSGNVGKDTVYLRNVRFVDISTVTDSTDMLRSAVYGTPEEGSSRFPYYADVALASVGYYHVDLAKLQNPQLAGNDESPLLLANLLNVTPWSNNYSIAQLVLGIDERTNDYMYSCEFTINGITRDYRNDLIGYMSAATWSDVPDYAPVDAYLHDLLVAFMKNVSGSQSHANEWLEVCCFYSHYGDGKPVGNPIMGLMKGTAIPVGEGTYTADLTRNMQPFPCMIYSFTPTESAIYKLESLIPENLSAQYAAQMWLYDDATDADHPLAYGGEHISFDGLNEHNFEVYRYLQAGHKYYIELAFDMQESGTYDFKITKIGQSFTKLVKCSADTYNMVLDEEGNFTGAIVLAGAIKYKKDDDGYYRALNRDGTMGDYIYLDVVGVSTGAVGGVPLNRLVDKFVSDPKDYSALDYKMFDFRYTTVYYDHTDENGNEIVDYDPKVDITQYDARYKDYTDILKGYFEDAPTDGEYKGLIKVDQQLVDILSLYVELRLNAIWDGQVEQALENEWLRFCWYNRTYSETNP